MGFKMIRKGFPTQESASALKQSTAKRFFHDKWMSQTEQDPIPEGMTGTRDLAAKMEEVNRLRRENAERENAQLATLKKEGKILHYRRKPTYIEAWDNMSEEEKAKHGSFEAFEKAAIEYNK